MISAVWSNTKSNFVWLSWKFWISNGEKIMFVHEHRRLILYRFILCAILYNISSYLLLFSFSFVYFCHKMLQAQFSTKIVVILLEWVAQDQSSQHIFLRQLRAKENCNKGIAFSSGTPWLNLTFLILPFGIPFVAQLQGPRTGGTPKSHVAP